jgi:hypothetical protein
MGAHFHSIQIYDFFGSAVGQKSAGLAYQNGSLIPTSAESPHLAG